MFSQLPVFCTFPHWSYMTLPLVWADQLPQHLFSWCTVGVLQPYSCIWGTTDCTLSCLIQKLPQKLKHHLLHLAKQNNFFPSNYSILRREILGAQSHFQCEYFYCTYFSFQIVTQRRTGQNKAAEMLRFIWNRFPRHPSRVHWDFTGASVTVHKETKQHSNDIHRLLWILVQQFPLRCVWSRYMLPFCYLFVWDWLVNTIRQMPSTDRRLKAGSFAVRRRH